jgi:hypothetical protein
VTPTTPTASPTLTNGSGAAALLSAAIGSFALAVLAIAGDKSATIKSCLIFYKPTGPLSGVTTTAMLLWLATWAILELRWRKKSVALTPICATALVLLVLSIALTFPTIADLF